MSFMSLFLAVNKEILKKADTNGNLPIHLATRFQSPAIIDYMLKFYPESGSICNRNGELPLHIAIKHKGRVDIKKR
jgi:ankyrin repeat protein